jgi:hypothetical protein
MPLLPSRKAPLFFMFLLTLLLVLQCGIALLHYHHRGSYYDDKDHFHQISAESPAPDKWTTLTNPQSKAPITLSVVCPANLHDIRPWYVFSPHSIPPVRSLMKSCAGSSPQGRAPPRITLLIAWFK